MTAESERIRRRDYMRRKRAEDPVGVNAHWRNWYASKKSANPEHIEARNKRIHKWSTDRRRCEVMNPETSEVLYKRERKKKLKHDFGLSETDFAELVKACDNLCQICGKPETCVAHSRKSGRVRPLAVDHCHKTGKIRGLLCSKCNSGIGLFDDDPQLMLKAMTYLEKHGTKTT